MYIERRRGWEREREKKRGKEYKMCNLGSRCSMYYV